MPWRELFDIMTARFKFMGSQRGVVLVSVLVGLVFLGVLMGFYSRWASDKSIDHPDDITISNRETGSIGGSIYTNSQGKFSLQYPKGWMASSETNHGNYKQVFFQGTEGEVMIAWGDGFGGSCPQGYEKINLANQEVGFCKSLDAEGAEILGLALPNHSNIGYSGYAKINPPLAGNRPIVLKVLSTLKFLNWKVVLIFLRNCNHR